MKSTAAGDLVYFVCCFIVCFFILIFFINLIPSQLSVSVKDILCLFSVEINNEVQNGWYRCSVLCSLDQIVLDVHVNVHQCDI